MELNKYQTAITEDLIKMYPQEVIDQLYDVINNIPFIKHLISADRKYARDLPRDEEGKIIVDISKPHILENMDYFRPAALHFKEHGCYTMLRPNRNPNSEYMKWIIEERRRCWEGMVRPSDGEWVTGYMYWYLNYCPIMLSRRSANSNKANRVEDFPDVWEGIYWRFHYLDQARKNGHHAIELARRGCSKSYSLASMMSHNFVLGENEEARKRTTTVLTAYQNQYLSVGKDGTLSKFVPMIDFVAENTQFPKLRLKDSPQEMVWQQGYKDKETGISKGSLNLVMGVSSKDDEGKLRGKRGYIFFEEMGSFPNLLSVYNTVRYGLEDGNAVFGLAYLVGTAAEDASDFSSAKEMLYNPEGYNIQGIPNVYDKLSQGKSSFGFFFPSYINRQGCYNEDGVSDVIKALLEILEKRYDAKYKTNDPKTIIRVVAEMPITPAEATIKVDANKFPVTTLTERLVQLDTDPNELNSIKVGRLEFDKDGKLAFIPTGEKPIRHFPTKDNKVHGAIEFFQMPEIDKTTGEPFANRYILGHDPVDNDTAETMSLSSTFVLDLWTDRIVVEYTGRQDFADENFEICRRLCLFYNGKVNYENNKKGLFAYFSRMNSVYLMTDTLKFLRDQQQVKAPSYGNAAKGTPASQGINNYAIDLIRDWLLKPITVIRNVDGVDQEVSIPNLYHIQSRALLQELISFNEVGNFDRVSSMGMLMLLRQDKIIKFQGNFETAKEAPKDPNYLGNDPFFNNNYDKRWGSKFP